MTEPSPGPWTDRQTGYEQYQIADANGAEVAVVVRACDATVIGRAWQMRDLLKRLVAPLPDTHEAVDLLMEARALLEDMDPPWAR